MAARRRAGMFSAVNGFDALFVGSGVNSLTAAALLSRAGWRVCVLERNEVLGGAIRTSTELTAPGFTHELMSSWHPLFAGSAAYAELGDDLRRHGLEYLNTDAPTATLFPDGEAAFLSTSLEANVTEFERHAAGDGAAWSRQFAQFMASAEHSFGVLSAELWSTQGLNLARKAYRSFGRRGLLEFAGHSLVSAPRLAGRDVRVRACARPARALGAAHGPRAGAGGRRVHDAGHRVRDPARRHAGAEGRRRAPRGGACRGRARRRRRAPHRRRRRSHPALRRPRLRRPAVRRRAVYAGRAVIASVTPTQLYGRLLSREEMPAAAWDLRPGLPLRPRRDADPPRARRAAAVGLAARPSGSRAPPWCTSRPA